MKRYRDRPSLVAVAAIAATLLHLPSHARGAPRSVYNGDAFTSAPNTASASSGDGVSSKSGTYSYSFPISVPPGRLGMQPTIGLHYSSDGAIYGGLAAGWSLDFPSIQLDTSDGLLVSERRWVSSMSSGERLVPTNEPTGPGEVQVYRARYDLAGLRYARYAAGHPYEWVVRAPDGAIYSFGRRDGVIPVSEIAHLSAAEDEHGNTVHYDWSWSKVAIAPRLSAFVYQLDSIRYTSNPAANLPAFARVDLAYEGQRPCLGSGLPVGSQLSVRTGTPIVHGYGRLKTISTSTVDREANGGLVRTYSLRYDEQEERCDLDISPRRVLMGIKATGYAVDGGWIDAPPVTFDYHPRELRGHYQDTWTVGERENGHLHMRRAMFVDHMLVDMDGDGLPDRLTSKVEESCSFYWQRNTGFGFEEARRHIDRPRLPYGETPDDWALDDAEIGETGIEQRCALNLQYTLVVSEGVKDADSPCRHDGKNYRVGTMVNWRFIDVDRDGLVDMVAGVDANELAVRPDDPGFDHGGLLDQVYERYSPGTFYADIAQLLDASVELYDGDVEWACENPIPVEENKSYPWIVFRNTGGGHFASPETWAMPVPLLASTTTSGKEIGKDQVGPAYAEVTLPGGTASLLADPFSFVDVDGDGLLDVVSSFKSAAELDGSVPPSEVWRVFRGRPDGLFDSLPDDEPYLFRAPVHAHANGVYVDGGMYGFADINEPIPSTSFAASASGLYELNGDGVPDFAWIESDSYEASQYESWNTTLRSWLSTGAEILSCASSTACALTVAAPESVADGGVSNLSVRTSSSAVVWVDLDDDGAPDHLIETGVSIQTPSQLVDIDGDGRQDLVSGGRVRYSVGDAFLEPRPLVAPMRWGVKQSEFAPSSFHPASFGTTMLMDIDGDGRLDPMIHQVTALDPDGNQILDGLGLEVFEEAGVWAVYLASREPPGLLRRISNGMGGVTYVDYASVRDDWVVEDWHLPVHAWVVSAITTTGGSSSPAQVTTYHYRDPAWIQDEDGKYGFRGFRHVGVAAPTGSLTETLHAYDLHYKGLAVETIVSDSTLPGEPPRTISSAFFERVDLNGLPLIVARQRDTRTCRATSTVSECRASGELLRAVTDWRAIEANGAARLYVPWRETSITGDDITALGAIVTETAYVARIDQSTFRVKPERIERRVLTENGATLLGRSISVYDQSLRELRESHLQIDDSRVAITRFTQDPQTGLLLATELPESVANDFGQVTATVYDSHRASVRQVVNPLGHVVTTIRDLGTGATMTTQGPQYKCTPLVPCVGPYRRWRTTVQRHDGLGRPTSLSRSFDNGANEYLLLETERHTYHEWNGTQPVENKAITEGRFDATSASQWTRTETTLDGLGRPLRTVARTFSPSVPDAVVLYQRDARGLVVGVESPDPSRTDATRTTMKYEYDGLGRMIRSWHVTGLGGTRHVQYDGLTLESHLESGDTGPAARVRMISDVRGRLVRVEESTSLGPWAVTDYRYDANDNLERVIDADGLETNLGHDLVGNRRWVKRGERHWNYHYDLEGRVVTSTVPHPPGTELAHTSQITYDALGRIKTRAPAAGDLSAEERNELAFGPVSYTYDQHTDALGAAGTITTPASIDRVRYDPSGNVTWSSQRFTAPGAPTDERVANATYNALGSITSTVHADGTQTLYAYDRRGLPSQVSTPQLGIAKQVRNPAGLVVSRTLGYGSQVPASTATWAYDPLGRLREQQVRGRLFSQLVPVAHQIHDYFSSGDVRHVDERIVNSYRSFDFTYDQQSQIRSARDDRGYRGEYEYTPAGRLLDVNLSVPAGADTYGRDVHYDYDEQDLERVRALVDNSSGAEVIALGYDEAGSITGKTSSDGSTTYRYDGDGRLRIVVRSHQREVYHYDASGRRVLAIRSSNGAVIETRRNVGDVQIIQQGGSTTTELTISLATPVARIRNGSLQYLHHNATGNLLVALQTNGAVAAGFSYGAFGDVLESQGQADAFKRRFQDHERDELSGWYDYGHRLYDPETLIWNRVDPLYRFAPDVAGAEPRRMSLYTFSLNNPLRYVDPDGLDPYQDQGQHLPPDVEGWQQAFQEARENLPQAAVQLLLAWGEFLEMVDVTGVTDMAKVVSGLGNGDWEMVKDGGGSLLIGVAAGFALGKVFKGVGKAWKWASSKGDEVIEGSESLARLGNVGDDVGDAAVRADHAVVQDAHSVGGAPEVINRARGGDAGVIRPANGRVEFNGLEVRGVRDLSHVSESTLRKQALEGFAARDVKGQKLVLHHHQQNPAGPIIEMQKRNHSIGNPRQHPYGNTPGSGLTPAQRAEFNAWRTEYWRARARGELARRGLQ